MQKRTLCEPTIFHVKHNLFSEISLKFVYEVLLKRSFIQFSAVLRDTSFQIRNLLPNVPTVKVFDYYANKVSTMRSQTKRIVIKMNNLTAEMPTLEVFCSQTQRNDSIACGTVGESIDLLGCEREHGEALWRRSKERLNL